MNDALPGLPDPVPEPGPMPMPDLPPSIRLRSSPMRPSKFRTLNFRKSIFRRLPNGPDSI